MEKVITIDLEYVLWLFRVIAPLGSSKDYKEVKKHNDDLKKLLENTKNG